MKKFYKTNPPKNGHSDSKHNFIVMKRGPKALRRAQRAPQPSAGARRRGSEYPKLVVYDMVLICNSLDQSVLLCTSLY